MTEGELQRLRHRLMAAKGELLAVAGIAERRLGPRHEITLEADRAAVRAGDAVAAVDRQLARQT